MRTTEMEKELICRIAGGAAAREMVVCRYEEWIKPEISLLLKSFQSYSRGGNLKCGTVN